VGARRGRRVAVRLLHAAPAVCTITSEIRSTVAAGPDAPRRSGCSRS
jgi:hypothetical protein